MAWLDDARTHATAERFDEAVVAYRNALQAAPQNIDILLGLSRCLMQLGFLPESYSHLQTALSHAPNSVELLRAIALNLERQDRRFSAIPYLRRLAYLQPEDSQTRSQLSILLAGIGATEESLTHCRKALELDPGNLGIAANYLLFLNYSESLSTAEIANEHFRVGARFAAGASRMVKRTLSNDKIRIGYLSADFRCHPVGKIFSSLIGAHDRSKFCVYLYHDSQEDDRFTQKIHRNADHLRKIVGVPNDELLFQIRNDHLDVLVDLGGFTGGANRLQLFAQRASPVQVSFLGYPHTTSLPGMNFRITDQHSDPPSTADRYYAEELIRLNAGMLAWGPYEECRTLGLERRSGPPVIGSFNNVSKISLTTLRCWAEILRRHPETTLLLKYGDRFEVPIVQERFLRLFCEHGVNPEQIRFHPCVSTLHQHLSIIGDVDLALDSFPYQGTMTSLETLSVGSPIVSLAGSYYAHRATSAMLLRMGFPELVAQDADEYIGICCELLSDLDGLRSLRSMIRERFYACGLTNPSGFMAEFEQRLVHLVSNDVPNSGDF